MVMVPRGEARTKVARSLHSEFGRVTQHWARMADDERDKWLKRADGLIAMIAASQQSPISGEGWQDISTAPDQGPIMVWDADNDEPVIAPLRGQENSWWLENYEVLIRATHWRPLPAPPVPSVSGPEDQGSSLRDTQPAPSFQSRVLPWLMECFGAEIAADRVERCDRFIEEALELAQSLDWPQERAHALVEYVYGRSVGEPHQEVGGVMVTLAALCEATGLDMQAGGDDELARIMRPEIVLKIRAKQAAKPTGSALPDVPLDWSRERLWLSPVVQQMLNAIAEGQIDSAEMAGEPEVGIPPYRWHEEWAAAASAAMACADPRAPEPTPIANDLADALTWVLPLAKGYAEGRDVAANHRFIQNAEEILAAHAKGGVAHQIEMAVARTILNHAEITPESE